MRTRRAFLKSLAALAVTSNLSRANAAAYPSRPITMIVPFPAGGPTDAIGRVVAEGMRASLGQPIVIQNVTGVAGNLGTERVARAVPDGYTVGIGNSVTHVNNGAIYPLKYDVLKDFEPISPLVREAAVIVARKDFPANNLREFIAWLKANPDKALLGTGGVGSDSDVIAVFFKRATDTRFQVIPYRGLGPVIQDIVAGHIDFAMSLPANTLPQVHAGTIKAFAITAKTRLAGAPEIPTVDEAGLPEFYQSNWHALFAPKGVPVEVIVAVDVAVKTALADPATKKRLVDLGQDVFPAAEQTPQALAAFQKAEIEARWPIIKAAGIRLE